MRDWHTEVRQRLAHLRLRPSRLDEIADEVAQHVDDRYHAALASGLSERESEDAARRELGRADVLAREVASAEMPGLTDAVVTARQGERLMQRLMNDLGFGWRAIRRLRGATALAVVAFALGIGITTAVFSVFYGVLLKPLPYPDADRMVQVFDVQPACDTCPASYTKYIDWRTRNTVFEEITGVSNVSSIVTGRGDAEQVALQRTTWSQPAVYKVQPAIGRWFSEAEDTPGGDRVVVLGYEYWRDRFGGSTAVLGTGITINGSDYRVIGVMPQDYQRTVQLFRPLQMKADPATRGNHFLPVYARLKPGVTVAQAQKDMVALGGVLAKEFGHNHGIDVQSYPERVLGTIRQPLQVLMGAVFLVLLIACANIANLLLASGTARQAEFALRAALGATRWDLARQLLAESLALAALGAIFGLVLAKVALNAFVVLGDQIVPRATTVSIDIKVLAFAAALAVVTGVLCALWPIARLDPRQLAASTREGGQRSGVDVGSRRFGNSLVVAEIALAFSLLAGSGLLVKNLMSLEARPLGFQTEHLIAFDLPLVGTRYNSFDAQRAFYNDLLPRLRTIPGVQKAAGTRNLPVYGAGWNGEVQVEGGNPWPANSAPLIEQASITGDYFAAFGMPIRAGRAFTDADRNKSELVTILTKNTADKFWPGQNPIGRRISNNGPASNPTWLTVVGIVDDVRAFGLQSKAPYQMYIPADQSPFTNLTVVLRVAGDDPSTVVSPARQVIREMDPSLPLAKVQTLASVVSKSVSQPRLISTLTSVFGGLAGLLAAVGVYGVMSYNVRRDRRQFAIRLALGADPSKVRRLILLRGVTLGTAGVVIGGGMAYLLTGFMQSLLVDVAPTDPWVFGGVAIALFAVAVVACARPAFVASRTDPMGALRGD